MHEVVGSNPTVSILFGWLLYLVKHNKIFFSIIYIPKLELGRIQVKIIIKLNLVSSFEDYCAASKRVHAISSIMLGCYTQRYTLIMLRIYQ